MTAYRAQVFQSRFELRRILHFGLVLLIETQFPSLASPRIAVRRQSPFLLANLRHKLIDLLLAQNLLKRRHFLFAFRDHGSQLRVWLLLHFGGAQVAHLELFSGGSIPSAVLAVTRCAL